MDLEQDDDGEPSLGWTLGTNQTGRTFHAAAQPSSDISEWRFLGGPPVWVWLLLGLVLLLIYMVMISA